MGEGLEEKVEEDCPNCGASVEGWSDFLDDETLYKKTVCSACDYEIFKQLDYLSSGF